MAILAVLVAVVSLLGHRTHTEEVVLQNKVSDQWAYYQAKNIRRHTDELFADLVSVMATNNAQKAEQSREKYQKEADRYRDDQKEIDAEAKKLEQDRDLYRTKDPYFDYAEVLLQIAIVMASIAILATSRPLFFFSLGLAGLGAFLTLNGFMLFLKIPFLQGGH